MKDYKKAIFEVNSEEMFNSLALEVFHLQAKECDVYSEYLKEVQIDHLSINNVSDIPFLPIELFKTKKIIRRGFQEEVVFSSSSTTSMTPSKHFVADIDLYIKSLTKSFNQFYGTPDKYVILALLPSYLERSGSSLVYMAQKLMSFSGNNLNGFYLHNFTDLYNTLIKSRKLGYNVILLGVSFALIDFAEEFSLNFPELIVIETGGMKGRGVERSRDEIHKIIKTSFGCKEIHSEYGMAELLSQSYALKDGLFESPPWKRIYIRDLHNPFKLLDLEKVGGINIIDLANLYSCSFIQTEDLGKKVAENKFYVLGRIENSEIRGCNLLLS